MTQAYLVAYGANPSDRLAVYEFPSAMAARTKNAGLIPGVPPGSHAGGGWTVIEDDAVRVGRTVAGETLAALYNAIPGVKPVVKFESRAVGAKRLLAALAGVARPAPTAAPAIPAARPEEKEDKVSDSKQRGRARTFADGAVIRVKVNENPCREGKQSHARFALLSDGMSVGAALAAGVISADLHYFVRAGHIAIEG